MLNGSTVPTHIESNSFVRIIARETKKCVPSANKLLDTRTRSTYIETRTRRLYSYPQSGGNGGEVRMGTSHVNTPKNNSMLCHLNLAGAIVHHAS